MEVISPGGSPVAATNLIEFMIRLVVEPLEGKWRADGLWNNEGVYSRGGTGMWGMIFYEKWS
jgi:hypothetical protein